MDTATCELRLTRYLNAPVEEVWAALTEPSSVGRWLGPQVGLSEGRGFEVHVHGEGSVAARVRAATPESWLELDWAIDGAAPSHVRFQLESEGSGTKLTLDHRRIAAVSGMHALTWWTSRLGRFERLVEAPA